MKQPQKYRSALHPELENVDFLSVFKDFDEGVIITDTAGVILYYNEAMAKIDNLDSSDAIGKKVTEIYDLTDDGSMIMECLKNSRPIVNRPLYYRTRIGKVANTIHKVFPLFKNRHLVGAVCFVKDYNVLEETIASVAIPRKKSGLDNGTIYTFSGIIGENSLLLRSVNTAQMAANSPSPIMLYGETGIGKELFAQSIHNHSYRSNHRYIPVNCAAIPENLLEGILFGTSKGAFTGALDKAGLFERASGGSLFLDEVDSMSIGLQAKILRVLQERKVRRVGSLKEIDIDLKIISSVNKEPHRAIEEGILRPDLFYRLGVVFISIPPLRRRRDDMEKLTQHFLKKHNAALGKGIPNISSEVAGLFKRYHWPGNIRELEHVIEGAMNMTGPTETIEIRHLQGNFSTQFLHGTYRENTALPLYNMALTAPLSPHRESMFSVTGPPAGPDKSLVETQVEQEKMAIENALANYSGNVSKAADSIRISRQLLHYKMKKHNLNRKDFILCSS
jgi:arginine utilization regulatory protein